MFKGFQIRQLITEDTIKIEGENSSIKVSSGLLPDPLAIYFLGISIENASQNIHRQNRLWIWLLIVYAICTGIQISTWIF